MRNQQLSDIFRNLIQNLHGSLKTRSRSRGDIHYNLNTYHKIIQVYIIDIILCGNQVYAISPVQRGDTEWSRGCGDILNKSKV